MNLTDKVIIVTGSSRGLGKEIALKLAKEKPKLVLCARSEENLYDVKKEIEQKYGTEVLAVKADVTKEQDVKKVFSSAINKFRKVDVLINNAGLNVKKQFYEYSEEEWDLVFNTNIKSVFFFTKEAHKHMKQGKIAIISSVAGFFGDRYYSAYCASKHAIEGYAKSIRRELKKGVKLHVFHPYRLRTDFDKGYKIKSPEHHMINPALYAEYVVAVLKDNYFMAAFYFLRNVFLWIIKLIL